MAKKLTKKDLVVAYKELDKVIGIEPPIEYDELSLEEFEEELYKTYVDLVEEGDKFSKATQAVFDALTEKYGTEDEEEEDDESKSSSNNFINFWYYSLFSSYQGTIEDKKDKSGSTFYFSAYIASNYQQIVRIEQNVS